MLKSKAFELVEDELSKAVTRYKPMRSAHEGYAILLEEMDELWEDIKKNDILAAREEVKQVAAMAIRFLMDVVP